MKAISIYFSLIILAITQVNAQIAIDGNNSDWTSVPTIATESTDLTALKVYEDATNLYFYVEGTIGENNDFYIDADNNTSTGYDVSGYDFMFQNGTLYKYSGSGSDWSWTNVTTEDVQWQETASFIENKAPKSIINIFTGQLRVLSVTMDGSWAELSKIPASGTPALYTSPAALSVSPATLSGYTYVEGSGPSSSQSFTLSGSNLDGSQVAVTAPTDYEISLDNSTFLSSLTVSYSGSTLADTTIYVRLKAGLSDGTYNNELVTCDDNGTAADVSVTNNGTVTSSSGLNEVLSDFKIYSEKNRVHIIKKYNNPAVVEIFDLTGKLIHKQNITETNTEISLNVNQSIFIVKVSDENYSSVKKVLIMK